MKSDVRHAHPPMVSAQPCCKLCLAPPGAAPWPPPAAGPPCSPPAPAAHPCPCRGPRPHRQRRPPAQPRHVAKASGVSDPRCPAQGGAPGTASQQVCRCAQLSPPIKRALRPKTGPFMRWPARLADRDQISTTRPCSRLGNVWQQRSSRQQLRHKQQSSPVHAWGLAQRLGPRLVALNGRRTAAPRRLRHHSSTNAKLPLCGFYSLTLPGECAA